MTAGELLARIREANPLKAKSLGELRRGFERFYLSFSGSVPVDVRPGESGGVPGLYIREADAAPKRGLLFFHGGGFSVGSPEDHADLAARLGRECRAEVFSPAYRLAPEHPFPAAVQDCLAAYRGQVLDAGLAPERLALCGISAGGTLALAVLLAAAREGLPRPGAVACLSPAPDMRFKRSRRDAPGDWIGPERLAAIRTSYLAGHDPRDPLASPLFGDFSESPPILIQAGDAEILYPDIKHFADTARKQGADVRLETWPGMFHCWQVFAEVLPEGGKALASVGTFVGLKRKPWGPF